MGVPKERRNSSNITNKELSQFWYCPYDRNMLQIHHSRTAPSPYFQIFRRNIEIGVNNAVAIKKIPPEAVNQTLELINFIFEKEPARETIDLVGVICPICNQGFSAPKISHIEEAAKDQARALFEQYRALETKNFGPFRIVDHFGLARGTQDESEGRQTRGLMGRLWWYIFILGFRTIIMVLFLYYILGLEMKIGKKWLPLGPILLILSVMGLVIIVLNIGILDPLKEIIEGFY
jgi:hypothetical protein